LSLFLAYWQNQATQELLGFGVIGWRQVLWSAPYELVAFGLVLLLFINFLIKTIIHLFTAIFIDWTIQSLSISWFVANPKEWSIFSSFSNCSMYLKMLSLFFSESFFESSNTDVSKLPNGRVKPTTTGQAKGHLPASS